MKYKDIPGTDLKSSSICLGTAEMGSTFDRENSFKMMDSFLEYGGNFFDSAHVYANWLPIESSMSEKTIGEWVRSRSNRSRVILATKGAHPDLNTMHISRMSNKEILTDLEESLQYFNTDYIDLYWLHRDDPTRPVGDIIEFLNEQVKLGKIRYFGASNWKAHRIKEGNEYALEHGLKPFSASEILWSLATVNEGSIVDPTIVCMNDEEYEYYKEANMAVIPFTSQARGFFTKIVTMGLDSIQDWVKATYYNEENMRRLQVASSLAKELSTSVTSIALAYLMCQSITTIPIVGPQSIVQMKECLKSVDVNLTHEMICRLEGKVY